MPPNPTDSLEDLPLELLHQIDQVCRRFETEWGAATPPVLENYLSQAPTSARSALLGELLELDVEYRRKRGESPSFEDYAERFPDSADLIRQMFAEPGAHHPPLTPDPCPLTPATSRYELFDEIARGGMGVIRRARDADLCRDLAVKVLLESHQDKPEVVKRFVEEAQIGGQLQHPGIPLVYELGRLADNRPFIAMKLVKGRTLGQILAERTDSRQNLPRLLDVFDQVCQTMAYVHSRHVIHRDLKPTNIIVGAFSEVQIMDWGLAKVLKPGARGQEAEVRGQKSEVRSQESGGAEQEVQSPAGESVIYTRRSNGPKTSDSETRSGSVMGTPAYMSPEQALGEVEALDERTDVFALGAILCEILTGSPPYVGEDSHAIQRLARRGDLGETCARVDGCGADADLVALTKRCLAAEPKERPRNAAFVAGAVSSHLRNVQERVHAAEFATVEAKAKATQERKAYRITLALAAVIVLVVLLALGSVWQTLVAQRDRKDESGRRAAAERQRATSEQARADLASAASETEKGLRQQSELALNETRVALAEREYLANNVGGALLLLDKCLPEPGQPDHRGWEWYYLKRLCRGSLVTLEHRYWVYAVAFSPDGQLLASVGGSPGNGTGDAERDGEVQLWEAATGRHVATLLGDAPTPAVRQVAFSPDGRWLVAVDVADTCHVWEVASHRPVTALPARGFAFLPDGQTLAVVGREGQLQHVHPAAGAETRTVRAPFEPPPSRPVLAAFGLGGRRVAIRALGGTPIHIVDATTGEEIRSIESPGGPNYLTMSPDGRLLIDQDRLFKTDTGQDLGSLGTLHSEPQFSPDSQWIARITWSETLLHKAETGQLVHRLIERGGEPNFWAFSPDSQRLATPRTDQTVRIWRVATGEHVAVLRGHTSGVLGVAFSADGRLLASAGQDRTARVWDLTRDPRGRVFATDNTWGEIVGNLAFGSDGQELLMVRTNMESRLERRVIAARGDSPWQAIAVDLAVGLALKINESAISADSHVLVAASRRHQQEIKMWDCATGSEIRTLHGHRLPVQCVAASRRGERIASMAFESPAGGSEFLGIRFAPRDDLPALVSPPTEAGRASELTVWDATSAEPLLKLDAPPARSIALGPDGRLLAAAGFDDTIRVWDVDAGRELAAFSAEPGPVVSLAFSPDGQLLAAAGFSGGISVWDLPSGTSRYAVQASGQVTCVTFSPDGRRLASVGFDGVVHLWDSASGHDVFTLRGFAPSRPGYSYLARVVFSPDGQRIASNNRDATINVWDASP